MAPPIALEPSAGSPPGVVAGLSHKSGFPAGRQYVHVQALDAVPHVHMRMCICTCTAPSHRKWHTASTGWHERLPDSRAMASIPCGRPSGPPRRPPRAHWHHISLRTRNDFLPRSAAMGSGLVFRGWREPLCTSLGLKPGLRPLSWGMPCPCSEPALWRPFSTWWR